jgi:hypothetical protein
MWMRWVRLALVVMMLGLSAGCFPAILFSLLGAVGMVDEAQGGGEVPVVVQEPRPYETYQRGIPVRVWMEGAATSGADVTVSIDGGEILYAGALVSGEELEVRPPAGTYDLEIFIYATTADGEGWTEYTYKIPGVSMIAPWELEGFELCDAPGDCALEGAASFVVHERFTVAASLWDPPSNDARLSEAQLWIDGDLFASAADLEGFVVDGRQLEEGAHSVALTALRDDGVEASRALDIVVENCGRADELPRGMKLGHAGQLWHHTDDGIASLVEGGDGVRIPIEVEDALVAMERGPDDTSFLAGYGWQVFSVDLTASPPAAVQVGLTVGLADRIGMTTNGHVFASDHVSGQGGRIVRFDSPTTRVDVATFDSGWVRGFATRGDSLFVLMGAQNLDSSIWRLDVDAAGALVAQNEIVTAVGLGAEDLEVAEDGALLTWVNAEQAIYRFHPDEDTTLSSWLSVPGSLDVQRRIVLEDHLPHCREVYLQDYTGIGLGATLP